MKSPEAIATEVMGETPFDMRTSDYLKLVSAIAAAIEARDAEWEAHMHSVSANAESKLRMAREIEGDRWHPIETAPKDGSWVLLWWPHWDHKPTTGYWNVFMWYSDRALSDDGIGPTHWQPLPPRPGANHED